ncbi:AMP-binding protein [Reinekea marinisedimentorum]|uniref:Long-subunit acyl-CoA synthetase (AMP-forming) n=1 Tax=Reinekea marinisedimentorum TaxID=230495 RepID=A0A4R3I4E4_9GAMM|nr:AMP-binding protein [Reinekea marinisedimentorum]TCS39953.1 long-subunit acyl-CoA synthetase (AMP-forming) [Reinekea marinisedimentorum]
MEYRTPIQVLLQHSKNHPEKIIFNQPVERRWLTTSWQQAEEQARRIATGLIENGLVKGDRVAILAKNSAEWFIADWAIMMAGMVSVPVYATAGAETIRYILQHSESKAVFLGKLDSTKAADAALDDQIIKVAFPYPTARSDQQWSDWLKQYEPMAEVHLAALDEVMSIVYTSGSTGNPKGVVISYLNYASVNETHCKWFNVTGDDRLISYLPLAHITERGVIQGPGLYGGATFYFVESLDTFLDDIKHAQPTLFLSVPRLWTRFQLGVFEKLPAEKLKRLLRIPLVGGLIARKIRKGLGLDQVRIFGSGSAPISESILHWYRSIGIRISEGWGMTETTGLSCCNLPFKDTLIGTIGVPADCVEMSLSEEGEILIRGEAVFEQYYKNKEATEQSFVDGWFRTGDKATLTNSGAFKIIGRVKEAFKTGKGKYVAPVPIESMLAENSDIEQICVMGSGRKQPVAVVVLAEHVDRSEKSRIQQSLEATLNKVNGKLEGHQKLDCLIIAEDSWTIENHFLTPTLKIRRLELEVRYGEMVQQAQTGSVIWEADIQ